MKCFILIICTALCLKLQAQESSPANNSEAEALLKKVSEKYSAYKNISASFNLLIQRPVLKPGEDERKYVDTIAGQISLAGDKFKISIKEREIYCDGKTIWTYLPADKEVQVNTFEESDDMFSPSKIFSFYKEGYLYQVKEKVTLKGRSYTVIEMAPPNKKLSYFKIDVTIDDATLQFVESKIYEKNGVRYLYKITRQSVNTQLPDDYFTFSPAKHPNVKVVDLR